MGIAVSTARASALSSADQSNNPFVAWNNLGAAATLGGTAVVTGGEAANAVTGSTYDKWRPDVTATTATLTFDFGSAVNISFAAIASHNTATYGASVRVQRSTDGSTWADAGAGIVTPATNAPVAWRMVTTSNDAQYWRFYWTGLTAGDDLAVGIAFMGDDLVIPRRLYQGFAPVLTNTEVQLQSNVSIGAHLLGSSVISRGSRLSAEITYVDPTFIRSATWLAFQTSFGEGKGFFFAWRPTKYVDDLHYCARDGDVIRPANSGPRDLMSIGFSARVYQNG